jgi:hypothetical protein
MRRILLIGTLLVAIFSNILIAVVHLRFGTTDITISGEKIASIPLLQQAKPKGMLYTYASLINNELVLSAYSIIDKQPKMACIQKIPLASAQHAQANIVVVHTQNKAAYPAEFGKFWSVKVDFVDAHGQPLAIGATETIANSMGVSNNQMQKGSALPMPFSTKQQANDFAEKLKQLFHNSAIAKK